MTSIFSWNMRGFNKPRKHNAVKHWVRAGRLSLGCLLETRVQAENFPWIFQSTFPGWSSLTNYDHHRLERIWVVWSDDVEVVPVLISAQMITCWVRYRQTGDTFLASFIYASNFATERKQLWKELELVATMSAGSTDAWIVLGDFNVTLSLTEHSRPVVYASDRSSIRDFQEIVGRCGLSDLTSVGPLFTWSNNQDENPICKKLDRALVNPTWLSSFPHSVAKFEMGGVSDHARICTELRAPVAGNKKPFKFFNHLTSHSSFLDVITTSWTNSPVLFHSRQALLMFHSKLKALKQPLRNLNKDVFGNLPARVTAAYDLLCCHQSEALSNPNAATFTAAAEAWESWYHLSGIEEQFFYQKSRVQWLKLGDRNNNFYFRTTQSRNSKNAIRRLVTANGVVVTEPDLIKIEAACHFQSFLQTVPEGIEGVDMGVLSALIEFRCSREDAALLIKPIQAAEIRDVLFSMPSNKAPGPDGYQMEFYKAAWPTIGADFVTAVQSFFLYGFLPKSINATLLALIPKSSDAERMSEYRPIACCNVVYKVISKLIARRLQSTLPLAIEMNQCAFVKGRLLLENVLLATELVKEYHNSSLAPRAAIKLDISKAFDSIQWDFIEATLRAMHYPDQFVAWIMCCIKTAAFSVSVNGELEGFFSSARGIRQGCALSPYLYVIVSNVLSRMLNKAAERREISYHPKCKDVKLSHLSFADDIMVFTDGSPQSLRGTLGVFEEFAKLSGLNLNIAKSTLYAGGRGKNIIEQEAVAIGLSISTLPAKYLGLPLTTKTMTRQDYEPLVEKIKQRLQNWTCKSLSFAGRLQLIQSVIYSTSNFWSSAFCLPKGCLDEIESQCSAFLWSGSPAVMERQKYRGKMYVSREMKVALDLEESLIYQRFLL